MNSKERRAWLTQAHEQGYNKRMSDRDIIAKVALDEISELDERIKTLENEVKALTNALNTANSLPLRR